MSDFDKEAERERLREQYEQEQKDREATQRMSELLLKGATMTNAHCDVCGDPIFRYDDQEFCPTCQQPKGDQQQAEADEQAQQDAEATAESQTDAEDARESTAPAENGNPPVSGGSQSVDTSETPDTSGEVARTRPVSSTETPVEAPEPAEPEGTADAGSLGHARASLTRTVTELAQRAEESDDLGSTREYLIATKEAAEALEAVNDAGR
jgi:uncharacterized Zn finger protein (UPF0148 family)